MPDLFDLVIKWWKQIVALVVLSLLTVGTFIFLMPQQYLAVATAVPASSFSADRAKIFGENIEALYSNLGLPEDLDMITGTAQLDTVYLAVTDQFNLFDHYKIKDTDERERASATMMLKKNTHVFKSEYGELKVKVWDTDQNLAPQLANAIMDKLQAIHRDLQSAGNEATLKGLQSGQKKLQTQLDSMGASAARTTGTPSEIVSGKKRALGDQLQQYEKLIGEYQLMVDSKPPVLLVVEKAKKPTWPDRPKRLLILVATGFLSFLFALLMALVLQRRKTSRV